jgi:uncharacterized ferritin-like protein (DUF455 family)
MTESRASGVAASRVAESRARLQLLGGGAAAIVQYACAGIVQTPDLPVKIRLARQVWLVTQCADQLVARLPGLKDPHARREPVLPEPRWWPAPEQAGTLVPGLLPRLAERLATAVARTAPLADEPTLATLRGAADLLAEAVALDAEVGAEAEAGGTDDWPWDALAFGEAGPALADGVPQRPARSGDLVDDPAYSGPSLADDLANRVEFLHAVALGVEVCAAEACAAMIAGNPGLPWGLRRDLARQINDEARHFRLFEARILGLGGRIGQYPVEYEIWDRFRLGSGVAEQLMIEQRIGESVGLDGGALAQARFARGGDAQTASIFDFVNADEVTHVALGNRWLGELVPAERDRRELEDALRRRLAEAGSPVKTLPFNEPDRLLAGYSPRELDARRA